METIYYHLSTREISVCDRASGEVAPVSRRYACVRNAPPSSGQCAPVLDFSACRRRLTGEGAPSVEVRTAKADSAPTAPAGRDRVRRPRPGFLPDLCATLAIVVMAVVVIARFLPLF